MVADVRDKPFSDTIKTTTMNIVLYTDGGARGNPGPAAAGVVLYNADDMQNVLVQKGIFLGERLTNNEAEYKALLYALSLVLPFAPETVTCFLDSELVVKQLLGEYRVKNAGLKPLYKEVCAFRAKIPVLKFNHIPRAQNALADSLVNEALDAYEEQ